MAGLNRRETGVLIPGFEAPLFELSDGRKGEKGRRAHLSRTGPVRERVESAVYAI